jgi:hypothetical protein
MDKNMELANQFMTPVILFLLTLVFGFWLSHAGKPYNGMLFNVHKLIALACVVFLGIQFSKMLQAPDWQMVVLLTCFCPVHHCPIRQWSLDERWKTGLCPDVDHPSPCASRFGRWFGIGHVFHKNIL